MEDILSGNSSRMNTQSKLENFADFVICNYNNDYRNTIIKWGHLNITKYLVNRERFDIANDSYLCIRNVKNDVTKDF